MQASTLNRGASGATAGSMIRSVAGSRAPSPSDGPGSLWVRLVTSAWARPAVKLMLLACVVTALSWLGTRTTVLGFRVPTPGPGSAMLASLQPTAPVVMEQGTDAGVTGLPTDAALGPEAPAEQRAPGILADGRVVLNVANEEEMRKLPRVGPKRAAAILALRQRMGRFRSVRDLLRVKGLGVRTLQKIEPRVVLDPPASGASDAGR